MEDESKRLLDLWCGEFGVNYIQRNIFHPWPLRAQFWHRLIKNYDIKSILEVGCNIGFNLKCIEYFASCMGLDVTTTVINKKICFSQMMLSTATHTLFKDNCFELVFTCGVLCHLSNEDIETAMKEMRRVAIKYVMFMEYYADEEITKEYHGEENVLFMRPYDTIYNNLFVNDKLVEVGNVGEDDGFDDIKYWLYEVNK